MIHKTFYNLNKTKKNRIIDAVKKEFTQKGYANMKVMSICNRAEIPRSAYYRYFDCLEDSLSAVVENIQDEKLAYFKGIMMNSELDFISLSVNVLKMMMDDEETYLLMSTLSRNNNLYIPVLEKYRKLDFYNSNEQQIAIRNILMIVARSFTEEYYTKKKSKEECLREYKILVDLLKAGINQ